MHKKIIAILLVTFITYIGYLFFTTKSIQIDKIYIINLDRSPDRYAHVQKQLDQLDLPVKHERLSAFDGKNVELVNRATGERIKGSDFASNTKLLQGTFDIICSKSWAGNLEPLQLNMTEFPQRFAGEIGCNCSHHKVWQDIIDNGYKNALIFEDDIFLSPFFDKYLSLALRFVPKDAELLYLAITGGSWTYKISSKAEYMAKDLPHKLLDKISELVYINFKNIFFKQVIRQPGTASAYLLSQIAAQKIMQTPDSERKIITDGILGNGDVADGVLDNAVTRNIVKAYATKPLIAWQNKAKITSDISN